MWLLHLVSCFKTPDPIPALPRPSWSFFPPGRAALFPSLRLPQPLAASNAVREPADDCSGGHLWELQTDLLGQSLQLKEDSVFSLVPATLPSGDFSGTPLSEAPSPSGQSPEALAW